MEIMMRRFYATVGLVTLAVVASASSFNALSATLEQNTRTAAWASVTRITIGQKSSRKIRLSGPWMDWVSSIKSSGGITGRNIEHPDWKTTLILDASESAARGNKNITARISCPPGSTLIGCKDSVLIPIKVFETGPINSIQPSGTVTPGASMTFTLRGERMDVAALLPRLLSLKNASITHVDAGTVRVTGITPSCGHIDVALTDQADGDEFPYRKGTSLQPVLAGSICGTSLAPSSPSFHQCPPGQNWNASINACQDE